MNIGEIKAWWSELDYEEQWKMVIKHLPGILETAFVDGELILNNAQLEKIYEGELHPEGLE